MLVRVDEHAVVASEAAAQLLELRPQLRVAVVPRVAREPAFAGGGLAPRRVVAERSGDDRARVRQQRLRMARHLGLRHREAHVREESALAALADVPLGVDVRLGARGADDVEPDLRTETLELVRVHAGSVPR